ncbi:MAG TPA: Zn-ribbon domain-containing OB-fold protein [Chloroflexota bacterium]|nr:Zn-ribbon domain-containing OB-fold protein [Chloroflexota bacterium]
MAQTAKPVPVPDHDTAPFWEACHNHELRAQRCASCGRFRWPPQGFCPACYSWEHDWVRLSGRGTVRSFSVVHHSAVPSFKDELPYVVAVITLDGTDGHVDLVSNVVGCPWEDVKVGMPVEVVFKDVTNEVAIHQFRPVAAP